MKLIFLGTSSMVPTKQRNHSAALLIYNEEGILIDCGEGTQRQLKIAGIKPCSITKILITHWHGDHVFGLPGLIQTLGSEEYSGTLKIYGPRGSKAMIAKILEAFVFEARLDYEVFEVESGIFFENTEFSLQAMPLKHSVPCLGFRFQEKDARKILMEKVKKFGIPEGPLLGKLQRGESIKHGGKTVKPDDVSEIKPGRSVCLLSDTGLSSNCIKLAENCDLLVCEATFANEHEEKAELYKHLTAKQAALIANNANVKKLILTHFSQRYKTTEDILDNAKELFQNVSCAEDFMVVNV